MKGLSPSRNSNCRLPAYSHALNDFQPRRQRLIEANIEFIPSDEMLEGYTGSAAEVDQVLETIEGGDECIHQHNLPTHLKQLCEARLLSAEQERLLFREMNFLKYRASEWQRAVASGCDSPDLVLMAERALARAVRIRDCLIRSNLRLVISIIKKFVSPRVTFDELLSEGIVVLLQAVEKFDYSRGFRFSTYAFRAVSRHVYRYSTNAIRERQRCATDSDGWAAEQISDDGSTPADERLWDNLRQMLQQYTQHLDRREQFVIRSRYALGLHRRVRTFQSLADILGVSKERVRQIEQRAVRKLRRMAEQSQTDKLHAIT
ncbi:MAG: sigma-70 family RNA polymerase sigma factor [Planctomycetota bacterium]|nr:MAG: sigma-70 family RNA polymerase sigma factor [Planctomycetota bacterium]